MNVCLLLISDGRTKALEQTLASAAEHLPPMDSLVWVDDADHELGFAGAIQAGWNAIPRGTDYVFHLEQDFTFNEPVDLPAMVRLLERFPDLVQVSLKRQPCNPAEEAAGGIIEANPLDFHEREEAWVEQRRYFTTTPSVYRASLCKRPWPQEPHSEGLFTHELLAEGRTFGIWGPKAAAPKVHHIGERTGVGY